MAPYWFIDPDRGDTIQLEVAPSLDTGDYYAAPKKQWMLSGKRTMAISEPYLNDGRLQLDMSIPIVEGGKFVGVAGVSRALSDQEIQLREFLEDSGDEAFLLSPRGRFVAASMDEQRLDERDLSGLLKSQLIESTEYGELFRPIVSSHQQEVFLATDPMDGKSYYYAPALIGSGNWKIVLRRSERSVIDPIVDNIIESIILGFVGVLIVVLLLSLLAVSVSRRLRYAMHRAGRIAEGDLRSDPEAGRVTASDETGVLLKMMDRMGTRLRGFVGGVIASGEAVERTADSVAHSSSDQVQVASALGQSTARIGDAVQQITATSQDLNETVASVTEAADQTSRLATTGRDELEEMQSAMQRLESATDAISRRLAVINERAAGITGIVSTITSVADQTNLLSVNASIEAEKAGDAGRGFLVVAREIRRLADRSSAATLDIESNVREVETAIGEGVREMSRFSAEVGRIVSDVTAVSGAMNAIIEQVAVSTGRFHSLQEGVQSQRKGAEAISHAMSDLQEGSEQTIRTTKTLVGASEDLRQAVEELGSVVSAFDLGPTPAKQP